MSKKINTIETSDYGYAAYLLLEAKGKLKDIKIEGRKNIFFISVKPMTESSALQLETSYYESKYRVYNDYLKFIIKKSKEQF